MALVAFDSVWQPSWLRPWRSNVEQFRNTFDAAPENRKRVLFVSRWRLLLGRKRALRRACRWLAANTHGDGKVAIVGHGAGARSAVRLAVLIAEVGVGRPRFRALARSRHLGVGWRLEAQSGPRTSVRFLGLWDLAGRWNGTDRRLASSAAPERTFHAIALDEYRPRFRLVRMTQRTDPGSSHVDSAVNEVWFSGTHDDLAGRPPSQWTDDETRRATLIAMTAEAHRAGVAVNVASLRWAEDRVWSSEIGERRLRRRPTRGVHRREVRKYDSVHDLDRRPREEDGVEAEAATTGAASAGARFVSRFLSPAELLSIPVECETADVVDETKTQPFVYVSYDRVGDDSRAHEFERHLGRSVATGLRKHGAATTVVLWTKNSINSDAVRTDAMDAPQRNVVHVRLDRVDPPLGFRSVEIHDLSEWPRGDGEAAFLADVTSRLDVEAVEETQPELRPRIFATDDVKRRLEEAPTSIDAPATTDSLNRRALAAVVNARLAELRHHAKGRPINMLIDGPWGSGKSTLLNLIEKEINPDEDDPTWLFVRFDAWRQERVGPPWWALMEALRLQMVGSMTTWQKCRFWFRERFAAMGPVVALLVVFATAVLVGVFVSGSFNGLGSFLDGVATVASSFAFFGAAVFVVGKYLTVDSARMANLFVNTARNPMEDVAWKFRWLAREAGRPVVLVIDDLDRCDQEYVVELLDALQTLTRNPVPPRNRQHQPELDLFVIVAADGAWLRTSYRQRHSTLVGAIEEPGRDLGDLFLAKIFDFSVPVPEPPKDLREGYLDGLLNQRVGGHDELDDLARELVSELEGLARNVVYASSEHDILAELDNVQDPTVKGLLGGQVLDRLNAPDIQQATDETLQRFGRLLGGNPRVIKRFVIEYRVSRALRVLSGSAPDLEALALWSVLRVRLPTVALYLQENPEILTDWKKGGAGETGFALAMIAHPDVAVHMQTLDAAEVRKCFGSSDDVPPRDVRKPTPRLIWERSRSFVRTNGTPRHPRTVALAD